MKIRTRITGAFTLIITLLFLVVGTLTYLNTRSAIVEMGVNHLETTADIQKTRISNAINSRYDTIRAQLLHTHLIEDINRYSENHNPEDKEEIELMLNDVKKSNDYFKEVMIIGIDGYVMVSTQEEHEGKDYSDHEYYLNGKNEIHSHLSGSEWDSFSLFGPFILNDQLYGVMVIESEGSSISEIVNDYNGLGDTGEILLGLKNNNGDAQFLHDRRFESEIDSKIIPKEQIPIPINQALNKNEVSLADVPDYRGEKVIAVTRYIEEEDWGLVVKMDQKELFQPLTETGIRFLILWIIAIILSLLTGYLVSISLSRPIEKLRIDAELIESGEFSSEILTKRNDEVGALAKSLNRMRETIKDSNAIIMAEVKEKTKELQKFKLAVENSSNQITMTDPDGIVLFMNRATEKLTGFSKAEVMGKKVGTKDLWGGFMDEEFYKEMWETIRGRKEIFVSDIKNRKKNGEKYLVNATIIPILSKGGEIEYFLDIERDVTNEKEAESLKTEFVSLASHQLLTPITAIKWTIETLLSGDFGELTENQLEQLKTISISNEKMITLVNSLLNVSRIEMGTMSVNPEEINLEELINSVIEELTPSITTQEIQLTKKFDPEVPSISLDKNMITMVVQNLISNAIKYNKSGGKLGISLTSDKKTVQLEVSDTGIGILKFQESSIFRKLFRGDNAVMKEAEGSGLGLYIAKSIIEGIGGEIWFKSEPNIGTTFYVKIPKEGMKKNDDTTVFVEKKL